MNHQSHTGIDYSKPAVLTLTLSPVARVVCEAVAIVAGDATPEPGDPTLGIEMLSLEMLGKWMEFPGESPLDGPDHVKAFKILPKMAGKKVIRAFVDALQAAIEVHQEASGNPNRVQTRAAAMMSFGRALLDDPEIMDEAFEDVAKELREGGKLGEQAEKMMRDALGIDQR